MRAATHPAACRAQERRHSTPSHLAEDGVMVAQTRVRCAARQAKTLSRPGARGAVSGLGVGGVGGGGGCWLK